ncbi:hypothetical protein EJB05_24014, partial [Eragrostis curvula]
MPKMRPSKGMVPRKFKSFQYDIFLGDIISKRTREKILLSNGRFKSMFEENMMCPETRDNSQIYFEGERQMGQTQHDVGISTQMAQRNYEGYDTG